MRLSPRLSSSAWAGVRPEVRTALGWGVVLAGIEIAGRVRPHELTDFGALGVLSALAVFTARQHRETPLTAVRWVAVRLRRLQRRLRTLVFDLGVDLRETPALERAVPPLIVQSILLLASIGTLLGLHHGAFPSGARDAISTVSYVVYVVLFGAVLLVLVGGSIWLARPPLALVRSWVATRFPGARRRTPLRDYGAIALFVTAMIGLGFVLPPWIPLVGLGVLVVASLAVLALPRIPELTLVWRPRGGPRLRGFDYRWVVGANFVTLGLVVWIVSVLAAGEVLFGAPPTSGGMPITSTYGIAFAWVGCVGTAAFIHLSLRRILIGWGMRPDVIEPPTAFVHGIVSGGLERWVRGALSGWRVRVPPDGPTTTDVQIRLGSHAFDADRPERWPLELSAADIDDAAIVERLRRRDVVQKRRILVRGLERLFKRAAGRSFSSGDGFTIGLQHWYVTGLVRDSDRDADDDVSLGEVIGPPYHRVFPVAVRQHFGDVMRALELDLIFVEDGVGFRKLRRVLRTLFALFDRTPPVARAEERHFAGVHGVSVVIHDVALDRPFTSDTYPEPDYEDVGRARVLHVFRDRGGDEVPWDAPVDLEGLPLPAGSA